MSKQLKLLLSASAICFAASQAQAISIPINFKVDAPNYLETDFQVEVGNTIIPSTLHREETTIGEYNGTVGEIAVSAGTPESGRIDCGQVVVTEDTIGLSLTYTIKPGQAEFGPKYTCTVSSEGTSFFDSFGSFDIFG